MQPEAQTATLAQIVTLRGRPFQGRPFLVEPTRAEPPLRSDDGALDGLGGGSLAKYCYRYLPDTKITAIEIDPEVIAVRDQFFMPPESDRFEIVCEDGAEFVRRDTRNSDILLVDGFDKDGQPAQLCALEFYRDCRSRLNPGGIMVVNLCDDQWKHASALSRIRECFGFTIDLPLKIGMNRIIFAFKDRGPSLDRAAFLKTASNLEQVHPMSFVSVAREIWGRINSLDRKSVRGPGAIFMKYSDLRWPRYGRSTDA